ncbi:MAG: hypothetical protein AAGF29_07450, partial [Pseudomonadota bacterium]
KGLRIVHLKTSANLLEDCEIADILVAEFRLSDACQHLSPQERPRIFDGSDLQAKGAVAIHLASEGTEGDLIVERAITGSARPWNTHRFAGYQ